MPNALMRRDETTPVVITLQQIDLIKKTIAPDATDAELSLFFYDCQRRGVHPLDKLLHFTKRNGKYTPVTSIDFFRSRAQQTGEHMGTDDAVFVGAPGDLDFACTVTVYRLVHEEKVAFTATARFVEYLPAPPNDFMWKKMPHGQLSKCCEALALRKAFPQELADLHTVEEFERSVDVEPARKPVQRASEKRAAAAAETDFIVTDPFTVKTVVKKIAKTGNALWVITLSDGKEYTTRKEDDATACERIAGSDRRVRLAYRANEYQGRVYFNIERVTLEEPIAPAIEPVTGDELFGK